MYMESLLLSQNILFGLSIAFLFVCIFNYKLHVGFSVKHSSITESLFWVWGPKGCPYCHLGGGGGGQEDGIAMLFSHHIYCAQSKVKWGAHGVNGGGRMAPPGPT